MTTHDPATPSGIRDILSDSNIQPRKSMGQNFLADRNILDIIIRNAALQPADRILEIGPGLGVVTQRLIAHAGQVMCIEKDPALFAYLKRTLGGAANLDLRYGDALKSNLPEFVSGNVNKVISNLPYSVGSAILVDILQAAVLPEMILIMIQSDVAARIASNPGTKEYGLLAILSQMFYDIRIVRQVSNRCFFPPPRVSSSLIMLNRRKTPLTVLRDRGLFLGLIKWTFSHRRKQLRNILAKFPPDFVAVSASPEEILEAIDAGQRDRPENLSVQQWGKLANILSGKKSH